MTIAQSANRRAKSGHALREWLRSGRLPALFVALGCLAMAYGFLNAEQYRIATAEVHGVQLGDPQLVVSQAGVLDRSIVRVDPDEIARRVAAVPWVAGASVRLELPNTVVIDLTERKPAIVWQGSDGAVLIDAGGQVMLRGDDPTLPHVTTADVLPLPGVQVDALDVAATQAVHDALGQALASLTNSETDGFQATLTDGRTIAFGDASRMPEKLTALQALAARTDLDWTFLDLGEPDRPYYR